jgi:ABC-type transporter Mla subunit MlaD
MSDSRSDARRRDPRNRISTGITRTRLKFETKRSLGSLVWISVAVILALLGAGFILTQLSTTLFKGTREVHFMVGDAYGASEKISDIRFKGIRAGKVTKIEHADGGIELTATIAKEYGPLYQDAQAQLRPATPLQDVYLDVTDPGQPSAGRLGNSALPETQVHSSVNIDDVLAVFDADERTRLKELLDNLGNGLDDRGDELRAAVVQITPFVIEAGRITQVLAQHKQATARLVHNASILTNELGSRTTMLRRLVTEGAATFGTLQQGSPDLDATLRELPSTLVQINTSFDALRGVADRLDTAVNALQPVADELPATLSSVRALNTALAPAVSRLRDPVRQLVPLAESLNPVASNLSITARALRPSVPAFERTTVTLGQCQRAITGFFQWNASLSKFGDLRGPIPRGNLALAAPDTGFLSATRSPGQNCVPGPPTIGGRPSTTADEH